MDSIDELGPELALAFTCLAAVGSSMVRRFRIEDAKSCTRVCRRILACAPNPPLSEVNNHLRAPTRIDAISRATTLLTRRLGPLDDMDTIYLGIAEAAIGSLLEDPAADTAVVLHRT